MNPWAIGAIGWLAASVIAAPIIGRLLRGHTHPAAGTPVPPHRAAAGEPPRLPHPLPGQPGQAASPPPVPDHDCGPINLGIVAYRGRCVYAFDHFGGGWKCVRHCGRVPFDADAWEAKLPGVGPRDGESLTEWERRIES